MYNLLEDLRAYLEAGSTKTSVRSETDCRLAKFPIEERRKNIKKCFEAISVETTGHLSSHPEFSH